ncbi:MAG: bifunctional oligoribonuclease/PAP phosphatase NrnA [Flavobacterium sp.]|nr:bifunctional oligoribonuclease/PAP phosphatase NrnA [Flavobacterium sp.]
MNEKDILELKQILSQTKKIAIIPHRNPDGDAMGAALGMYHFLLKLNHQVTVIAPNEFSDFLAWMPGADKILIFENETSKAKEILQNSDIVFALDFNALHRTGDEMELVLKELKATFVMIDHHQSPDSFAKFTYSNTNFGSTCEMVYNFISFLGETSLIDKNISTSIYTGILTDSGGFKYPKTTGKTHRIVANLIDLGAENTIIPNLLYDNNSYSRLQLLGRALQNMKVFYECQTAYTVLTQNELDEFKYVKGDTEGIVNYGLTIKNINFAAIFIEHSDEKIIKISFRSQGKFDVNQFAREHFSGGGHINAAGGKSNKSMKETIEKFENLVQQINKNNF